MKSKKLKSLERLAKGFPAETNPPHLLCENQNNNHFLKWCQIPESKEHIEVLPQKVSRC